MARPAGPKTRNNGTWTESKFHSFIKNNLRKTTFKWQPIQDCLKNARTRRGYYRCNGCKEEVPASIRIDGKRHKNAIVDHIQPIIDPDWGFISWDDTINRMFCEADNLQVLCKECHDVKSNDEKARAAARRQKEKE